MASTSTSPTQCFTYGTAPGPLQTCSRCKVAKYCSPECQAAHWAAGHKAVCKRPNYLFNIRLEPTDFKDPPVWRTMSVPATLTFSRFHLALQTAFGWANTHTYDFGIGDPTFDHEGPRGLSLVDHIKKRAAMDAAQFTGGWKGDPNEPRRFLLRIVDDEVLERFAPHKIDKMHLPDLVHPRTPTKGASRTRLCDVLEHTQYRGHPVFYTYDLGDMWEHKIEIIGAASSSDTVVCTDGHGHGVAEDAGSIEGWQNVLNAYRAAHPSQQQKEKMHWFEQQASNRDPHGLKNGGELRWNQEEVNQKLSTIGC